MTRRIGWALVGTGAVARSRMAPAIARHAGSRIVAVVSSSAARAAELASATNARGCTALDEALRDSAVDAVYIGTTNDLHAEQAIACLRAGRHVLCEKPLALSLRDADAMIAAATESGRVLAVDHHLRAAESMARLRTVLASGAIGAPRLVRSLHRCHVRPERRDGWRMTDPGRGAGAILDLTVHTADALRFVCGREVASVCGQAGAAGFGRAGIEGAVSGTMTLAGGVLASFCDTYSGLPASSAFEVHGDEGWLRATGVLDGDPRATIAVGGPQAAEVRDDPRATIAVGGEPAAEVRDDPYLRTVERFADAVRGDGEPAASADDGRRALAVALALRAAVAEGRSISLTASLSND